MGMDSKKEDDDYTAMVIVLSIQCVLLFVGIIIIAAFLKSSMGNKQEGNAVKYSDTEMTDRDKK
jgi:hypothetical protein